MPFERFTPGCFRHRDPSVSVSNRGLIAISHSALNEYNKEVLGYVILYFDAETNRIGIEFVDKPTVPGAIRIRKRERQCGLISGVSFLKRFKINYSETRRYPIENYPETKIITVTVVGP